MKKLMILLIMPVCFGFKTGDEIDEKRMNRDLEIAKNILSTLISSGSDHWFGGTSIDATYIKDYGVVFTIPEHLVYFHGARDIVIPDIPPIPDIDVDLDIDNELEVSVDELSKEEMKRQKEKLEVQKKELEKHRQEIEKHKEEIKQVKEKAKIATTYTYNIKPGVDDEINWEEVMITFMTDYADLIGQLKPEEKIVIKQKSPYNDMVFVWSRKGSEQINEQRVSNISAEVFRKDVAAFKSGKIKREAFIDRIKIEKDEPQKKVADLEMFANIFDRFYSHDLSETYYCQGKPRYEVLDGYGAVFHIKTSSGPRAFARTVYRSSGDRNLAIKSESESPNNAETYRKFKDDIKAFMLDYGRTIRSLNDDEIVMLDIQLGNCRDCEIPESVEVSVKMSTLKQYDQQKLSREKAINLIGVKENF
ncbi:MAG: hypothetical protein MI975_26115 [Cytophagales bacterium]|nr:hypothetical protein [Cytophagales bacterium]